MITVPLCTGSRRAWVTRASGGAASTSPDLCGTSLTVAILGGPL